MCSKPSMPAVQSAPTQDVVAPTYADAKASKASAAQRNRNAALAGRNVKTSSRGLNDDATTDKKNVLGA